MESWMLKHANGQRERLEDWSQINWRRVRKIVTNLRRRIFRARKLGQWKQLRRLQKLLIKSSANLLLSVLNITQVTRSNCNSGGDKEVINTPEKRLKLVNSWNIAQARPKRRAFIPKANAKKRPLGIPTVTDTVAQNIVKQALEPEWEAVFEANSYGYRPGRSCQDAIAECFIRLNASPTKGGHKWVLDAHIKGFFDNLAHESILNSLGSFPGRDLVKGWLKAGLIFAGNLYDTETGKPQGGVISPLLGNIGLHGLEEVIKRHNPKLGFIRYTDEFIVTAREKGVLESVLISIKQWLSERGLSINEEKTSIKNIGEGFDFLGFNLRHYSGKLLIKPQKIKVLKKCKELGELIKAHKGVKQEVLILRLNPILRGLANYYRGVATKEILAYISHKVRECLWKWCKRRHTNKSMGWIKRRYFTKRGNRDWIFGCYGTGRNEQITWYELYDITATPIIRHVKVKDTASKDDTGAKKTL